jgi:hypothetical protein
MQFKFEDDAGDYGSGYLAFTPPTNTTTSGSSTSSRPLLLVTDHGHDAVHVVDVVGRSHAGYLASPGSIAGPRGVAASGASPLVAVSAWKKGDSGDHVVVVYRGSGAVWEAVLVIGGGFGGPGSLDGQLFMPSGLRFCRDGATVCVADQCNNRVSVFRVGDGVFVRHMATGIVFPMDVEEVEGGWLVACDNSHSVEFVGDGASDDGGDGPSCLGGTEEGDGFSSPASLAIVPGVGLVVREFSGARLQVFATPDTIAMTSMSHVRVAWMEAVARAVLHRGKQCRTGEKGGPARQVKP